MQAHILNVIRKEIARCYADADQLPEIRLDTTLESLNLDSLNVLEVVYELENYFGITVEDSSFAAMTTINDLATMIEAALAAAA